MPGSYESKDGSAATTEVMGIGPEQDCNDHPLSQKADFGFIRRLWADPAQWLFVTGWIAMILFAFLAFMYPTDVGDTGSIPWILLVRTHWRPAPQSRMSRPGPTGLAG